MMKEDIRWLSETIRRSRSTVFFGGAGVSTESGIPDFRSAQGVFEQAGILQPEVALGVEFLEKNPEGFFDFCRRFLIFPDARPNAAHRKLAELESAGLLQAILTQNIDGLHQQAGSRNVLELHGTLTRSYCMTCGKVHPGGYGLERAGVPRCDCGGIVRPDIVLYGEPLDTRIKRRAWDAVYEADLLIVAGSSLVVYPAAGFVRDFHGRTLVLINRTETPYDGKANCIFRENVGEVFAALEV